MTRTHASNLLVVGSEGISFIRTSCSCTHACNMYMHVNKHVGPYTVHVFILLLLFWFLLDIYLHCLLYTFPTLETSVYTCRGDSGCSFS